ncbi:hypothetical protein [Streptomyces sp. NPDC003032]
MACPPRPVRAFHHGDTMRDRRLAQFVARRSTALSINTSVADGTPPGDLAREPERRLYCVGAAGAGELDVVVQTA